MKSIRGNIWFWAIKQGAYVVIPTNGFTKRTGECVMGRGLALQAAKKYPSLPKALGNRIKVYGNIPFIFESMNIITFPVKHVWWEMADLDLIRESAKILIQIVNAFDIKVLLPFVGCGNGGLDWRLVAPIIEEELGRTEGITICDRRQSLLNVW